MLSCRSPRLPFCGGPSVSKAPKSRRWGRRPNSRRSQARSVTDLGASTLLPGLINAHCHLDFTRFRGALSRAPGLHRMDQDDQRAAPLVHDAGLHRVDRRGLRAARAERAHHRGQYRGVPGTAAAPARAAAAHLVVPGADRRPLAHQWRTRRCMGALSFFESHPEWLGGFGLSPHAPYTASVDLYRLARTCGETIRHALHHAHRRVGGGARDVFPRPRPAARFPRRTGPRQLRLRPGFGLSHLVEHGVIGANWIIAHLNYLQDYDYELVAQSGASVVHCPKCHTYFGHAPFPMKALREHGVNVCLGTDSLASNNSLDMRAEMREAQVLHGLGDRDVLEMVLLNGAQGARPGGQARPDHTGQRCGLGRIRTWKLGRGRPVSAGYTVAGRAGSPLGQWPQGGTGSRGSWGPALTGAITM